MTNVKVRNVHGARLALGVVAAVFFAVMAPVLLVNGAAALLVVGSVVLALLAGLDATVSADALLHGTATVVATSVPEHGLAA
ncbi:hypothetical protein [Segeticoccus rhizosphaerae]|jgi:hypothetical protein|uniref:hypothetical protein n=1 Tax=Segeticoccus rhizosphaerae TaxID=1104777 RepID=UPI001265A308|nr:hypothetical protein [Segeticoccus rhizosphaerae]